MRRASDKPEHMPLLFCILCRPYVKANDDAANKYLYLKYTMWFLLTWTACKRRSWLSLFYVFSLSLQVRYSYMSNLKIFTCHCYFATFSRTCQCQCCLTPNILFSAIPFENMQPLLSLFVFYALFSWGIFVCFHGCCFLHFGCGCRELRVAQFQPPSRL